MPSVLDIAGKAAIGIEVPNQDKTMVCARELLDTEDFRRRKSPITFALGKDIVGKNVYADIARMPHLLIAGETGSGKSVCINTIIVSLIYGASPKDVQLILVDPKKVELKPYENIPHLRIPIVTDPKKAAGALNWAVAEMMNRYKIFAMKGAKDLPRYNAILAKEGKEKLPYLVIIIDELADEYKDKVDIYKVDVDSEQELAALFRVRSIPTLVYIPMSGAPIVEPGGRSKAELKALIEGRLL